MNRRSSLVCAVIGDLEWVAAYWPDLVEARLPGTARPWRQPRLTREQRAELDEAARRERLERSPDAPGEAPAPLDLGVLDTITGILAEAVEFAAAAAAYAGAPQLPPPSTALADARPYLRFLIEQIPALPDPEAFADHIALTAARWVRQIARTLALVHDGQALAVVCPWCRGVTPQTPAGGSYTWRVRHLPGDEIAIVCESGSCEPPSRDVGTWWRGMPVWPLREWDWLARRLEAREGEDDVPVRAPVQAGAYGSGGRA